MKTEVKAYRPVYPSPAALITSVDAQGRSNVLTLGEVFNININEPVILGTVVAMRVDADKPDTAIAVEVIPSSAKPAGPGCTMMPATITGGDRESQEGGYYRVPKRAARGLEQCLLPPGRSGRLGLRPQQRRQRCRRRVPPSPARHV